MKEGKRRFGALVAIGAIRMESITATAGGRIVKGQVQIIASQKPIEGSARLLEPARGAGHAVGG